MATTPQKAPPSAPAPAPAPAQPPPAQPFARSSQCAVQKKRRPAEKKKAIMERGSAAPAITMPHVNHLPDRTRAMRLWSMRF